MEKIRSKTQGRSALFTGIALLCTAGIALADDPSSSSRPQPTKEQREKMAEAHDQIAACLRSDKSMDECHSEMKKYHDAMMPGHHGNGHSGPPSTSAPPTQQ